MRLTDDLVDDCNGLASALALFLISRKDEGYPVLLEILLQELREETTAPWWKIEGAIHAQIGDRKQLLVYARPRTSDAQKVLWTAVQAGILAEYFAPDYDRYFFSLRPKSGLVGWAAFDGTRLRQLREEGADDLGYYPGVLETFYYTPRLRLPKVLRSLHTLWMSFAINWPLFLDEWKRRRQLPRITCRAARVHRNGFRSIIHAEVVIDDPTFTLAYS